MATEEKGAARLAWPAVPWVVLVVLATLELAACGGSSSSSTGNGTSSSSTGSSSGLSFQYSPATGTALPDATVNAPYSQTVQVTSGGTAPFQFAIVSAPAGFAIASVDSTSASLAGTPSQTGTTLIQLHVTDATFHASSSSYTLRVNAAPATLTITPGSLPNAQRTQRYSQFLRVSGGVSPFAWSLNGTLPAGLAFGSSTTASIDISGVPTAPGTSTFSVTVTDGSSPARTGTLPYTITVN